MITPPIARGQWTVRGGGRARGPGGDAGSLVRPASGRRWSRSKPREGCRRVLRLESRRQPSLGFPRFKLPPPLLLQRIGVGGKIHEPLVLIEQPRDVIR